MKTISLCCNCDVLLRYISRRSRLEFFFCCAEQDSGIALGNTKLNVRLMRTKGIQTSRKTEKEKNSPAKKKAKCHVTTSSRITQVNDQIRAGILVGSSGQTH
jgi:hypothetical protein